MNLRPYAALAVAAVSLRCVDLKEVVSTEPGDASDAAVPGDGYVEGSIPEGDAALSSPSVGGVPDKRSAAEFAVQGDDVILDQVTGLRWQAEVSGTFVTFADAKKACAARAKDSASDWRLPTRLELASLLNFGIEGLNKLPTPPFTKESRVHWTSDEDVHVGPIHPVWTVDVSMPKFAAQSPDETALVRCVRGTQLAAASLVLGKTTATVRDERSGRIWEAVRSSDDRTAPSAFDYCKNLTLEGAGGFRVPTVKELLSLLDESHEAPYLAAIFPEPRAGEVLSSSLYGLQTEIFTTLDYDTSLLQLGIGGKPRFVRCVR